jgi:hypothetical protein
VKTPSSQRQYAGSSGVPLSGWYSVAKKQKLANVPAQRTATPVTSRRARNPSTSIRLSPMEFEPVYGPDDAEKPGEYPFTRGP